MSLNNFVLYVNNEFSNSLSFVENENVLSFILIKTISLLKLIIHSFSVLLFLKLNLNGNDSFVKSLFAFHLFILKHL